MRGHGSLFNLPKYSLRMWLRFDVLFRLFENRVALIIWGWFRYEFSGEIKFVRTHAGNEKFNVSLCKLGFSFGIIVRKLCLLI